MHSTATVVIVPGLREHIADHWQTLLMARLAKSGPVTSVRPLGRHDLSCAKRVEAIQCAVEGTERPIIFVAHSGGVISLVHWAMQHRNPHVVGALLATPADLDTPLPTGYPSHADLETHGWLPVPRAKLPFPSIVAASSNDPLAAFERVEQLACDWGSECVNLGAVGHLNPASGFGDWPQAMEFIEMIDGWRNARPLRLVRTECSKIGFENRTCDSELDA